MMGLEHVNGEQLTELMRLSWTLAVVINGGRIEVVEGEVWPVTIEFKPAIADYGTWGCALTIDRRADGWGTHHGTVSSALDFVRKELSERLGGGYVRYDLGER